ncbi:ribonuclease P protein component [Lachnospiraceae bacterium OttesenSCG-928-E19]|nr:ribonuclease P protein component [Lachnospiraceae bacterium OttesenSCG-928-E19]
MRNTIKNHSDFQIADNYPIARTPLFIAKCRPTLFPGDPRYGLIVTKKTFKLAVARNRAKRLLRVWIRENEQLLRDDMDYVFIARRDILNTSLHDGVKTMASALKDINK